MGSRAVRCAFLDPGLPHIEVTLPKTVHRVTGTSSFGVVRCQGLELELNDSAHAFLPDYFAAAGARVEDEVHLRHGHGVRLGRIDGRNGTGYCFAVEAGSRSLFGTSAPSVGLGTLTTWLTDLHVTATRVGLAVRPERSATWAPGRAPHTVLVVTLTSGQQVLLDVRPAYKKAGTNVGGLAVAGGRLSRVSPPGQPEYLTLDAPSHVVHVLAPTEHDLDEVAELGAGLTVRALAS
jgi:hypothetical protein